jgi:hypothetical protein
MQVTVYGVKPQESWREPHLLLEAAPEDFMLEGALLEHISVLLIMPAHMSPDRIRLDEVRRKFWYEGGDINDVECFVWTNKGWLGTTLENAFLDRHTVVP